MQMHLSGGENRRAGAALPHHHRQTFRSDDGSHLSPSLQPTYVGQLDLHEIRRLLFEHGESVFRRTDALLSSNGNPDRPAQLGETFEISPGEGLLGIGNIELP